MQYNSTNIFKRVWENFYISYIPNKNDNLKQILIKVLFAVCLVTLVVSSVYLADYFWEAEYQKDIIDQSREVWHETFSENDKENSEVILDFDYVDSREGIVLQILHTGNIDSLKVDGKIKGGKPIKQVGSERKKKNPLIKKHGMKIAAVMMAVEAGMIVIMTVLLTLEKMGIITKEELVSSRFLFGVTIESPFVEIVISWILVSIMIVMALKILRDAFMIGVPTKLRSFGNSDDI